MEAKKISHQLTSQPCTSSTPLQQTHSNTKPILINNIKFFENRLYRIKMKPQICCYQFNLIICHMGQSVLKCYHSESNSKGVYSICPECNLLCFETKIWRKICSLIVFNFIKDRPSIFHHSWKYEYSTECNKWNEQFVQHVPLDRLSWYFQEWCL